MWLEVYYNCPAEYGPGWSSGSRRFTPEELAQWLIDAKQPILITHIKVLS